MHGQSLRVALLVGFLLAGVAAQTEAATIALTISGGQTFADGRVVGWQFTANSDISVTSLGWFDEASDGLIDRHEVGLWDSSQNLLASTFIESGTSAPLVSGFRFAAIGAVALTAGQNYFIAGVSGGDLIAQNVTITPTSEVTWVAASWADTSTLVFPGLLAPSIPNRYFGPNFQFEAPATVPEPATLLLLGTGLSAAAARRRLKQWSTHRS